MVAPGAAGNPVDLGRPAVRFRRDECRGALVDDRCADRLDRLVEARDDLGLGEEAHDPHRLVADVDEAMRNHRGDDGVDFGTWQSLACDNHLSRTEAVELVTALIEAAAGSPPAGR